LKKIIMAFVLAMIVLGHVVAQDAEKMVEAKTEKLKEIHEKCGDLEFWYRPEKGAQLNVFGMPIIIGSSLWVMSRDWSTRYYGPIDQPELLIKASVDAYQGGVRIVLHHTPPEEKSSPFAGTETFILMPDNSYKATLEFSFTKNTTAVFEWGNEIHPLLLLNSPYVASEDRATTRGVIPLFCASGDMNKSMVARAFKNVEISTRIGGISLLAQPKSDMLFFDYRKNKWAQTDKPIFWLGIYERDIIPGTRSAHSFTLRFPRGMRQSGNVDKPSPKNMKPELVKDALAPNFDNSYILPTPKELEWTPHLFPLSSKTKIYLGEKPGTETRKGVDFFLRELKERYNIKPKVIAGEPKSDELDKNIIMVGEIKRFPHPAVYCRERGLAHPEHHEGYVLTVDEKTAAVSGNSERGVFNGLMSLLQMVKVNERGIFLKGGRISDFPALDFRGIHCFSGRNASDQIIKAIRKLMACHKINNLVWECEYIIWDSHPELEHKEYGMKKSDARKVIKAADESLIEVTPLIQSLGHSEWIFTNRKNLDIAEDPESPYAYNPTNPKTYQFIFGVYQEALDFFKPKAFHIGHDEVTMTGRFPYRSKASGKSVTQLIMDDIHTLHQWFMERNVKVMLWGDMFIYPSEGTDACLAPSLEEAKKRRAQLPKDVTICDWHYVPNPPESQVSLKLFKKDGFGVIGSGWYLHDDIRNLAKACVLYGADGYLQTTWAGFSFNVDGAEDLWLQYWAYLWAAEHAWSGENTPADELPFDARQLFFDLWFGFKPLLKNKEGFTLDLSQFVNRSLEDNENCSGWIGYGADYDFSSFPKNQTRFGETRFQIASGEDGSSAILFHGKINPQGAFPKEIQLNLNQVEMSECHFLMNCAFRAREGAEIGEIRFDYSGGRSDVMKLVYGRNIFSFDDVRCSPVTRIAWKGKAKSGSVIGVYDIVWQNPEPGWKITKITIRSASTEASPILFAITGVK